MLCTEALAGLMACTKEHSACPTMSSTIGSLSLCEVTLTAPIHGANARKVDTTCIADRDDKGDWHRCLQILGCMQAWQEICMPARHGAEGLQCLTLQSPEDIV